MELIEILTSPYNTGCECIACISGTYYKLSESIEGREKDAIQLLHVNQLSDLLKNGNSIVDTHSKYRFAILLNLIGDPIVKLNITKKLITDVDFELDFFDNQIINGFNKLTLGKNEITKSLGLFNYATLINNALIYRRIPELINNKLLSFGNEKIIYYIRVIAALGYNHFTNYFVEYGDEDKIQLTSILFEQFLKSQHENLIRPIQELFSLINKQQSNEISNKESAMYIELTNKILATGKHECLPFKTTNYNAKNFDEYIGIVAKNTLVNERIQHLKNQQNQKNEAIYNELKIHMDQIQKHQEKVKKLQKQLDQNDKFQKRMVHLNQLRDLTPIERLKFIIQSEFSIYYYPNFLFENILEDVDQLPTEYRLKLLDKLQIVNRGALKELKEYLISTLN